MHICIYVYMYVYIYIYIHIYIYTHTHTTAAMLTRKLLLHPREETLTRRFQRLGPENSLYV